MCKVYYAAFDRDILPQRIGCADISTGCLVGRSYNNRCIQQGMLGEAGEIGLRFRLTKYSYEA
jgi:hypothetical protein